MRQITTYQTLREAILEMKPICCRYRGYHREICFHVLGEGRDGNDMALGFQFAGQTSQGALPPGGEWRCMRVDEIVIIGPSDGGWHTGGSHLKPQTCVKRIDVEVPRRG